jgi:hypothetical protein
LTVRDRHIRLAPLASIAFRLAFGDDMGPTPLLPKRNAEDVPHHSEKRKQFFDKQKNYFRRYPLNARNTMSAFGKIAFWRTRPRARQTPRRHSGAPG